MKTISNHRYSRKPFEDYKVRYKVEFDTYAETYTSNMDIYSTNENKDEVEKVIETLVNKVNVKSWRVIHTTTKRQDELSSELIDEFIKDLNNE